MRSPALRSDRLCRRLCIYVGNGLLEEASEPQQSLFSWAEFQSETPVKAKSRSQRPKLSSHSLFEWAPSLEQEGELLGTRR